MSRWVRELAMVSQVAICSGNHDNAGRQISADRAPVYEWFLQRRALRKEEGDMSELLCIARLKIHHGKLDEFKHLAARCVELVRSKDTGTLQCELYFNSDNTGCLVFERYRDSQALLDHHKNLGDTVIAILRTCSGSGEICGTPSPELIERLKDSPVQVYKPFQAN